jgi:1-acyl-sn-glycerol-3-phosphate acyltransferase
VPIHIFLFIIKLPLFLMIIAAYFLVFQWLPLPALFRKALLWVILGAPGIWWVDLQIDGVKKGMLAQKKERFPSDGSIIASSLTSPIDALYLATIWDPIFTVSYPTSRQVRKIGLFAAMLRALSKPQVSPPEGAKLVDLAALRKQYPGRVIVVFPECTTTNGRGILPLSPSLLSASPDTKIFPVNLRYTPPDITTPIPGKYYNFLWNLLSQQTHCIRVRIAEAVYVPQPHGKVGNKDRYMQNFLDTLGQDTASSSGTDVSSGPSSTSGEVTTLEQELLDKVAEALARLGRVKRVGLTVKDKAAFVQAWSQKRK